MHLRSGIWTTLVWLAVVPAADAQYTPITYVLASGVGRTTVGTYTVTGTVGQASVGATNVGGDVNAGGFWNQYAKATGPVTGGSSGIIVYSRAGNPDGTIWIRSIDGSIDSMVCVGAWPRLSHDARFIAHHKGSNAGPWFQDLYVYDLQTRTDLLLAYNNSSWIQGYSWSNGDTSIVFDYDCGIQRINRDGTNRVTLFQVDCYDDGPAVQPGSWTIAYHNAYVGILLTDAPSSNRRLVPNTASGDYWPVWSQDGQWISFSRPVGDSTWNYYKIHPDGSGLTKIKTFFSPQLNYYRGGTWTVDGSKLIVAATINGINGLYAIATDGSGGMGLIPNSSGNQIDFVGSATGEINLTLTDVSQSPRVTGVTIPTQYALEAAYPNPFNPSTTIRYALPGESRVQLVIYNVLGEEVSRLVDDRVESPGFKDVTWNAPEVASGVYFYRIEAVSTSEGGNTFTQVKKMLLLR